MSPNYRCETGGAESGYNYNLSPTVNSINDEKLYTQNNMDFSGISSSKNNFSKKYSSILNELSPSLNKSSNGINFKQNLNLMRIQSRLENKNERPMSTNLNNKIQDIKYTYFTQDKKDNDYFNSRSPLKTIGNFNNECNIILKINLKIF